MRHHHHRALVLLKRLRENLNSPDVKMVGRLVENQAVVRDQHKHRERHTRLLSTRHCSDALRGLRPRQTEGAHDGANAFQVDGGVLVLHRLRDVVHRNLVEVELLGEILREDAHLHALRQLPLPAQERQPAGEGGEERGLAAPVRAEDRQPHPAHNVDVDVGVKRLLVPAPGRFLQGEHLLLQELGRREAEVRAGGGLLEVLRLRDPHDPVEHLLLGLRGRGVGRFGAEARDVVLERGDFALLLLPLGLRAQHTLLAFNQELVVAPAEHESPLVPNLNDARERRACEEGLLVCHEHHGAVVARHVAPQPRLGGGVEVVGRLVEEEHVRLREEEPRQRDLHLPPAREVGAELREVVLAEPEAREHRGNLLLDVVAPRVLEGGLGVSHAVERPLRGVSPGDLRR
mmetsp:Transcript_7918/g.19253  ORF Transcript_7918/g.19253 Transcript_7918/m.19253 type:complete len:402 (+) Transcript_7918:749-1954(+)